MSEIMAVHLKCNDQESPLGIDTYCPALGWELQSGELGTKGSRTEGPGTGGPGQWQTAFRILVSSSPDMLATNQGDFWDTGKVASEQQLFIPYGGRALSSGQSYWWKVKVWDQGMNEGPWSRPACFETGLFLQEDWKARWIAASRGGLFTRSDGSPEPLFRYEFTLRALPVKARAYICGLGYHELTVNGRKMSDDVLAPGVTRYDASVLYQTLDVTPALTAGANAVGVMLGDGWYNCFTQEVWDFKQAPWRDFAKLLFEMHVTYADGTKECITSGPEWKTAQGPVTFAGLRNGEHYDARLEIPGWDRPGFDDSCWKPAFITRAPGGILRSQQMPPIRVTRTLKPVSMTQTGEGTYVYDAGQNLSGWARIRVQGPAGTVVTLRYGERIKEDGSLDQEKIAVFIKSGDCQTDRYTLKGEGIEEWEPRFTYHGFQYIEMTGYPGTPDLHSLSIRVVHTDLDRRGGFECSDPVLNAIQRNAEWSTLTNYHGIPTDCPHREKNGWTGDAQLSAEQVLLNFAPMTAYIKWMQDFVDIQRPSGQLPGIIPTGGWGFNWGSGPAWDSAIVLIPWYIYVYCGDTGILERMYEPIRKYVDYMTSMSSGHIVDFGLGDWCPPEAKKVGNCPTVVTDTAYYYTDARILSRIGEILGKSEEAARYRELATNIRNAFRERFLARENGQLTGMTAGNSQTALSCALFQGMAEPEEAEVLAGFLVQEVERCGYHIDSGILGAKYVMHALTEAGRTDLAYRIAVNPEYPGWGNWIARGATTLWEDWEGRSSLNHHMFSDISAWFYKALAGIRPDPDHPGFRHFFVCPGPVEGLTWVKAWHHCGYGRIDCSWQIVDGEFKLTLKVPVGCIATLQLPQGCCGDVEISLPDGSMEVRPADETLLQPAGGKAGQGYMAGPGEWMIRCEIIDASHKDE